MRKGTPEMAHKEETVIIEQKETVHENSPVNANIIKSELEGSDTETKPAEKVNEIHVAEANPQKSEKASRGKKNEMIKALGFFGDYLKKKGVELKITVERSMNQEKKEKEEVVLISES
jgi:hypothetical protein